MHLDEIAVDHSDVQWFTIVAPHSDRQLPRHSFSWYTQSATRGRNGHVRLFRRNAPSTTAKYHVELMLDPIGELITSAARWY